MKNLHHANLLIGTPEDAEVYLGSLCRGLSVKVANNPDFVSIRVDTFGIDEARELTVMSSRRAIGARKIFFICAHRLTTEAQNALLKTFEDPIPDTHFFLATLEEALILPTLRSRMIVIRVFGNSASVGGEAKRFLSLPIKNRLLFAKSFAEEEKNLPVFLDELLLLLRKLGKAQNIIERVYNTRRFANDTSVLSRLIIEHLSLVL